MAALFLDAGIEGAQEFVGRTLIPRMSIDMAREPGIRSAPCRRTSGKGHHAYVQACGNAGSAARPHVRVPGLRRYESACERHGPHEERSREPGRRTALDSLGFGKTSKADQAKAKQEKKQARAEKRSKARNAPQVACPQGVQIVCRPLRDIARTGHHGGGRPEKRIGKIEYLRSGAFGFSASVMRRTCAARRWRTSSSRGLRRAEASAWPRSIWCSTTPTARCRSISPKCR